MTRRFHAKFEAVQCAKEHAAETGRATGVYLDSLGFIVAELGTMTRTDVALVYATETTSEDPLSEYDAYHAWCDKLKEAESARLVYVALTR
jgi:hypothetical protein